MGKPKRERVLKDNEAKAVLRHGPRLSPQKLNLVAAADPRQEGLRRRSPTSTSRRKRIAGQVKQDAAERHCQRREQSRSRRRQPRRRRGACRQGDGDEALHAARPRPRRPDPEAVLAPDDRGPRSRRKRLRHAWDRKSIRSGCGSASTRPGIRAGSPTRANTASCCTRTSRIRETLMEDLKQAAVSQIVIERPHKKCRVTIHTARPGIVIGKKGADIEKLRKKVAAMTDSEVHINIVEVRKPEIDAQPGRAVDRAAARAPRGVPPRDEARRAVGDAARRRRASASTAAAVSAAPRSRAPSGIARAACRCTRCAPTSTTAPPPRTPPTARAASRSGSSRARSSSTTRWRPSGALLGGRRQSRRRGHAA